MAPVDLESDTLPHQALPLIQGGAASLRRQWTDDVDEETGQPLPKEQLVFFVRHGESRWNQAQAALAPVSMVWENDHGLSEQGRCQAEALREKVQLAQERLRSGTVGEDGKWLRQLLRPDMVCSSPFTRALQTACIGLKDIMPKAELLVVREAREHKRLGGADSTGIATGEEIPVRVRDEIRYVYEEGPAYERAEAAIEDFNQIKMDTSAVTEEWWGPLMGESFAEMEENIEALMCRLRRMRGSLAGGGAATVLVGHSLMIRSIFHSFLLSGSTGASFHAASLRTKVVPCCGVVGARIIWDDRGEPIIKEAVPLLDTVLAAPDDKETHRGCVCGRAKIDPGCVIA
eukprot:TRINITY_DN107261_c0_g1_i1.p1 TRINITY_DN107261_c0_g1~~TRINITY_DN107261_c0_g1_i1.p1  ORF type:complete len:345 (+),score=77.22 TRINITY_DN107261_c0_g1_i1:20-1054(+)